jgi:hypothetical protein
MNNMTREAAKASAPPSNSAHDDRFPFPGKVPQFPATPDGVALLAVRRADERSFANIARMRHHLRCGCVWFPQIAVVAARRVFFMAIPVIPDEAGVTRALRIAIARAVCRVHFVERVVRIATVRKHICEGSGVVRAAVER